MLAGLFIFMTITGASCAVLGLQAAMSSRYLDVTAVLVLPALAVAADALARRHRMLLAVVLALLVFGIPGNIAAVRRNVPPTGYFRAYRQLMTSLPRMSLAMHVPGSVHPEPNQAPTLTISWLLDAACSGPSAATPAVDRTRAGGEYRATIARPVVERTGIELPIYRQTRSLERPQGRRVHDRRQSGDPARARSSALHPGRLRRGISHGCRTARARRCRRTAHPPALETTSRY